MHHICIPLHSYIHLLRYVLVRDQEYLALNLTMVACESLQQTPGLTSPLSWSAYMCQCCGCPLGPGSQKTSDLGTPHSFQNVIGIKENSVPEEICLVQIRVWFVHRFLGNMPTEQQVIFSALVTACQSDKNIHFCWIATTATTQNELFCIEAKSQGLAMTFRTSPWKKYSNTFYNSATSLTHSEMTSWHQYTQVTTRVISISSYHDCTCHIQETRPMDLFAPHDQQEVPTADRQGPATVDFEHKLHSRPTRRWFPPQVRVKLWSKTKIFWNKNNIHLVYIIHI